MHISWLGRTSVKLISKPANTDVTTIIDAYKPNVGSAPRSLSPHIALLTEGETGGNLLAGDPFVISTPGEYETAGVLITATHGHRDEHIMVRIDTEGVSVAHPGRTSLPLTDSQLEVLAGTDVLLLPFGAEDVYSAEAALKVINTIEPRVVIPIGMQSDNDPDAKGPEELVKALGKSEIAPVNKTIVKKSTLPTEDTEVILLEKE